jgi:hypothetical protein
MNDEDKMKNKAEKLAERKEQIQEMREELAKNMGASNYFMYLESNIYSKASRGI